MLDLLGHQPRSVRARSVAYMLDGDAPPEALSDTDRDAAATQAGAWDAFCRSSLAYRSAIVDFDGSRLNAVRVYPDRKKCAYIANGSRICRMIDSSPIPDHSLSVFLRWSILEATSVPSNIELLAHGTIGTGVSFLQFIPEFVGLKTDRATQDSVCSLLQLNVGIIDDQQELYYVGRQIFNNLQEKRDALIFANGYQLCWGRSKAEAQTIASNISKKLVNIIDSSSSSCGSSPLPNINHILSLRRKASGRNRRILDVRVRQVMSPARQSDTNQSTDSALDLARYETGAFTFPWGVLGVGSSRTEARRRTNQYIRSTSLREIMPGAYREPATHGTEIRTGAGGNGELAGRVMMVTGAGSGIGRAVATKLAERGAHLLLFDKDRKALATLLTALSRRFPLQAEIYEGDVTRQDDVAAAFDKAVISYGGVDAVVSNAGAGAIGSLRKITDRGWHECMELNATSHFFIARTALRLFEAQGLGGSLVFIASKTALAPGLGFGGYAIAKAAALQVARVAAIEGGPFGVRSNVINPGALFDGSNFWSPAIRRERAAIHGLAPDDLEAYYSHRNLLRRPVTPLDVAEAAAFLVSDRAAATSGCILTVDAGDESAFPR